MSYSESLIFRQSLAPLPFRGKYPSRIWVQGANLKYVGRPVPAIFRTLRGIFRTLSESQWRSYEIVEFDQNGWINSVSSNRIPQTAAPAYDLSFVAPRVRSQMDTLYLLATREVDLTGKHPVYVHPLVAQFDAPRYQRMLSERLAGRTSVSWGDVYGDGLRELLLAIDREARAWFFNSPAEEMNWGLWGTVVGVEDQLPISPDTPIQGNSGTSVTVGWTITNAVSNALDPSPSSSVPSQTIANPIPRQNAPSQRQSVSIPDIFAIQRAALNVRRG